MKKNIPEYMYIGRHEKPYPYWLLRFRHAGKVVFRKTFRDSTHTSKDKALAAALKKRAEIAKKLGVDFKTHWQGVHVKEYRYTHTAVGKNNKTGVVGVAFAVMGGIPYYRASISFEVGRETVRSFNCETLGEKKAFAAAIRQRRTWEKQLKRGE